jgi:molybdenum cofactor cytidylyltransferase
MICAIVLAAGQSRRMGTQKLLLPFAGSTVIAMIVDQLLASPVDRTVVVVGRDREAITAALTGRTVSFVMNPAGESEMLDSLRCGLRALPEGCEAVLVVLGDQPGLTSALVDGLVSAFGIDGPGLIVATHEGRRGHPLLIPADYFPEVLTRFDDTGLRGLLHAHPEQVREFAVSSLDVLLDMDLPEDYRRALAALDGGADVL